MKLRQLLLTVTVLLSFATVVQSQDTPVQPPQTPTKYLFAPTTIAPLFNGEFENDDKPGSCLYWNLLGPHDQCPQEVRPPNGWTAWWVDKDYTVCPPYPTAQIEMRLEDDPQRVYSGVLSLHYFTFWRCHRAGIMQKFWVDGVKKCRASAQIMVWYSDCSGRPFDEPYDYQCIHPLEDSHMLVRVGISDHGFLSPPSEYVGWGEWGEGYGEWFQITTDWTEVENGGIFIIESRPNYALKHEDIYIDSVHIDCR